MRQQVAGQVITHKSHEFSTRAFPYIHHPHPHGKMTAELLWSLRPGEATGGPPTWPPPSHPDTVLPAFTDEEPGAQKGDTRGSKALRGSGLTGEEEGPRPLAASSTPQGRLREAPPGAAPNGWTASKSYFIAGDAEAGG